MVDYKLNEQCIIGMPGCGYGFASSRSCFLARSSDGDFQLEQDILAQVLRERNYGLDVALSTIDPGNFAFCTKICSRIIQSHFCIVLLNQSKHHDHPGVRIPNPNVHFEYGMMLSFRKHVIPMQREEEELAFNIYPLDTVKYKSANFKDKAEQAIDDAILRFVAKEPTGLPIGAGSDLLKYLNFNGLQVADVAYEPGRTVYSIGSGLGFNLLNDQTGYVFFGLFPNEHPREIVVRARLLLRNGQAEHSRVARIGDSEQRARADAILAGVRVMLLVSDGAPVKAIVEKIDEFQINSARVPVTTLQPHQIAEFLRSQYDTIGLETRA